MVAAGFRKRVIQTSNQTIGDRLKRARFGKRCSIREAEEATRIRAHFLLALESDEWRQLPSEVYGRGYLLQYADFLGLSRASVLADYEKQKNLLLHRCKVHEESLAPKKTFHLPRWFITPRLVSYLVAAVLVLAVGGYLMVQVNRFAAVPMLKIASPVTADNSPLSAIVVHDASVTLTGQTSVGATLSINNEQVMVDSDGVFHHKVELSRGENIIQIKAINRSKAERMELLKIVAEY